MGPFFQISQSDLKRKRCSVAFIYYQNERTKRMTSSSRDLMTDSIDTSEKNHMKSVVDETQSHLDRRMSLPILTLHKTMLRREEDEDSSESTKNHQQQSKEEPSMLPMSLLRFRQTMIKNREDVELRLKELCKHLMESSRYRHDFSSIEEYVNEDIDDDDQDDYPMRLTTCPAVTPKTISVT